MCKSEDKKGKAAQEQRMKSNFNTAAGKGVYATRIGRKALSYSVPLRSGQKHLIKFVLLVEIPGDLSDHGVGVAHKGAGNLPRTAADREAE